MSHVPCIVNAGVHRSSGSGHNKVKLEAVAEGLDGGGGSFRSLSLSQGVGPAPTATQVYQSR
jgi:hypothetical protein